MNPRGEQPRQRGALAKTSSLQEKVATFYYTLGLLCSTYPIYVLIFAAVIVLGCWFPLINLPFPGNAPRQLWTSSINVSTDRQPFCYVQQIVFRAAVLPWENDLTLGDAFRAPIYEAFKLLDIIRNYQHNKSSKTLGHVCLHIESIKRAKLENRNVLPQYSCLVLSPANFWQQDVEQFTQDNSILTTIFNHHSFQKGKTSIAEMLFGMHLFDTGIKRYPFRNRQRIIQYAATLFFKEYDEEFIDGLHQKLKSLYPLHQNDTRTVPDKFSYLNDTVLIEYPGEINYFELVPLFFCFVLTFFYYYFSVRKIELINSKLGMAFTVLVTVFGSLTMTMGICFFFGLTLSLQGGKSIFPFLSILVGLENVLVLTKSVVSTPLHLDVKIRNAQGLSKEGWSITKNLFLEITILTFGLFTFVPAIQEFCIFAIVGLITDFFLQMTFFSTVLGIDISRSENLVEKSTQNFRTSIYQTFYDKNSFKEGKGLSRSRSHPRLTSFPTNIVAGQNQNVQEKKIPKRLRLVNIWARTRFFQRSFMILMVIWICVILYNSDIIRNYVPNYELHEKNVHNSTEFQESYSSIKLFPLRQTNNTIPVNYVTYNPLNIQYEENQTLDIDKLKHSDYAPWLKLSSRHWFTILRKYNVSLSGEVIAVLPNIKLSHIIRPDQAVLLRNPDEKYGEKFQWQALAAALDPINFHDMEAAVTGVPQSEQPFYPTSPMEIALTIILCTISVIVLAYTFVVLYRCICSRNYAEWRASWFNEKESIKESSSVQVLLKAVPVILEGHQQEIECIASDGNSFVSGCLGGQLKVWDNTTGELLANIDRKTYFPNNSKVDSIDFDMSDYESASPTDETYLINDINTNFTNIKDQPLSNSLDSKYDFSRSYNYYYHELVPRNRHHNDGISLRNKRNSYSETSISGNRQHFSDVHSHSKNGDISRGSSFQSENSYISGGTPVSSTRELSDSVNNVGNKLSPIWCMDFVDNLIVIGCADGRLEFWEGTTGKLKCIFEDGTDSGISHIKMIGSKVVAARLCGAVDFFQLETYNQGRPIEWNFTIAYRRTHVRTGSVGSISNVTKQTDCEEDLQCRKILSVKAHQQPITCLDCEGGRVLSGSQDHTIKVFKLEDGNPMSTLHGHCGPITCLFIDRCCTATSGSGSQDGMLCVWDLVTGACMYNTQAHDGSITCLTYSESYIISLGSDERLCVWERFQGHLLNTIYVSQTFSNHILMLAPHLVVTARNGGLVIWDVRSGDCVRTISLARSPFIFIKQLILLRDTVLCDFGKQLVIVSVPLITRKYD